MRRQHLPLYAIALALAVVGGLAVGVPARSVAFGLLVLACPLMMLFMHGGHAGHDGHDGHGSHGGHGGHGQHQGQEAAASRTGTDPRPR